MSAILSPKAGAQAEHEAAPATGLFHSLSHFVGTLLGLAHTRLELLTTELQEEVRQVGQLLVWALIAAFAAMMALFLGALTVIFAFWDTHRVLVAVLMVAVMAAVAAMAAAVLAKKLRNRGPLLDATLAELAKDRDQLRARL